MSKKQSEKVLTYFLAMQLTLESMEGLEMTDVYRQAIPNFAKKYHEKIKQSIMSVVDTKDYADIYFTDEKSYQTLMESIENIAKFVATQPFDLVVALAEDMKKGDFKFENDE